MRNSTDSARIAAVPAAGQFGSRVKEKLKSLETELITEHNDEVRRLSMENAELRSRIDTAVVVLQPPDKQKKVLQPPDGTGCDDAQCHAPYVSPSASILQSKPVALPVSDGEVERMYWVHADVLDVIPHLQASRTRWHADSIDQLEMQHLPPHCSHVALGVLLSRLYSPYSWPEQKWCAFGSTALLEAVLLADMWGLAGVADEAGAALRLIASTKDMFLAVREVLDAIASPPSLAIFVADNPAVLAMSDAEVCQILVSAATTSNEKAHVVAEDIIDTRYVHGSSVDGSLCEAVRNEDLTSVSERHLHVTRVSSSGKTTYGYYAGSTKFKSMSGFDWICILLEKYAKVLPGCIVAMIRALECASNNLKGNTYNGYRAEYTPDAPSPEAVSHHMKLLLHIGAKHADAGDLPKDELGQVALRHPSFVSDSIIAAIGDESQQRFVDACSDIEWYSRARLHALRGGARASAIRYLAAKLGELSDDAAEFVRTELCMHAATNE